MHRPGIGPGPPAWQAEILPLDQRCYHYELNYELFNYELTYKKPILKFLNTFWRFHRAYT